MILYLLRRLVFGAAVLIGTSLITFALAFVVPADPESQSPAPKPTRKRSRLSGTSSGSTSPCTFSTRGISTARYTAISAARISGAT